MKCRLKLYPYPNALAYTPIFYLLFLTIHTLHPYFLPPSQLMPPDYIFDNTGNVSCYKSEEKLTRIAPGTKVKVKITGIRLGAEQIVSFLLHLAGVFFFYLPPSLPLPPPSL